LSRPAAFVAAVEERDRVVTREAATTERRTPLTRERVLAVAVELAARWPLAVVLGADTEVVLDGLALGKPRDAVEATAMLRALSGRTHDVLTGVHLLRLDEPRTTTAVRVTRVTFRAYDDRLVHDYVRSGEPLDKAGAYGIQGRGVELVESVDGSWSNVVGLPVEDLEGWLARIGVAREEFGPAT